MNRLYIVAILYLCITIGITYEVVVTSPFLCDYSNSLFSSEASNVGAWFLTVAILFIWIINGLVILLVLFDGGDG